jgi:transcriptional regulator with XRE-family HTH domain
MTHGNCLAMSETWFDRLEVAVKRDGRPFRVISQASGLGVNYLQQLLKDRKEPGVDRFMKILNELGTASAIYVLTGRDFTPEDETFIKAALNLDPKVRRKAHGLFRALLEKEAAGALLPVQED